MVFMELLGVMLLGFGIAVVSMLMLVLLVMLLVVLLVLRWLLAV